MPVTLPAAALGSLACSLRGCHTLQLRFASFFSGVLVLFLVVAF